MRAWAQWLGRVQGTFRRYKTDEAGDWLWWLDMGAAQRGEWWCWLPGGEAGRGGCTGRVMLSSGWIWGARGTWTMQTDRLSVNHAGVSLTKFPFFGFCNWYKKILFYSMEASFEMTFIWWNFYLSYFYYCHLRSGNCLERFEEVSFCCWNVWTPSLLITFCKMQKTQVDLKIKKKKDKQTQLSMQTLFAHLGR